MNNPPNINFAYNLNLDLAPFPQLKDCVLTLSQESGKKLMPLGTSKAIRAAVTLRTVCRKTCHVRSSSDCLQP